VQVQEQAMELVGYGVGGLDEAGRERAMDMALGSLAEQAGGITFRIEQGAARIELHAQAYIKEFRVEREIRLPAHRVLILSGQVMVELVEGSAVHPAQQSFRCKPDELRQRMSAEIGHAIERLMSEKASGATRKEGWAYLNHVSVEPTADGREIEVRLHLSVVFGAD